MNRMLFETFGECRIKGDEIWMLCPNPEHHDRHPTNFSFNLKTGNGFCFACGYKTNLLKYGIENGISYDIIRKILKIAEKDFSLDLPESKVDRDIVDYYVRNGFSSEAKLRICDESILELYGVYSDGMDGTIFFIKDNYEEVVSVWGKVEGSYLSLVNNKAKKFGAIFGEHIQGKKGYVVTEGFFDAMRITRDTELVGICCQGTHLSEAQISKLEKLVPLYVMMDGDFAGKKARDNLHKKLKFPGVYFCGGYSCDPDEIEKEKLPQIIENSKDWFEYLYWKDGKK